MPFVYSKYYHYVGLGIPHAANFEVNRLASFSNWPHDHPLFGSDLAKSGFKSTGNGDETECVFCGFVYKNWRFGEKADRVHQIYSPYCPIFKDEDACSCGSQVVPNIPINVPLPKVRPKTVNVSDPLLIFLSTSAVGSSVQETGISSDDHHILPPFPGVQMRGENGPATKVPLIGIPTTADGSVPFTAHHVAMDEMYPKFASSLKRQQSFARFPLRRRRDTSKFYQAGFFYTGHEDIVICFHCGLNLYKWLHGEDPAIAHARWRPFCSYLQSRFGGRFIWQVQQELQVCGQ